VPSSAQLWWHVCSLELAPAHLAKLAGPARHALGVLARDQPRDQPPDYAAQFEAQQLTLHSAGLRLVAANSMRLLHGLVEGAEQLSRDQLAHWLALAQQFAALAESQHRAPVPRAEDEDEMELEVEQSRDLEKSRALTDPSVAALCTTLLTALPSARTSLLACVTRAVLHTAQLDWPCTTLTRLCALLLHHTGAHDTRRVLDDVADSYTALWPFVRQSDEFRRLLRDLTGGAVEHSWQASTGTGAAMLLTCWLVLAATHHQLARYDHSTASTVPLELQTLTCELCACFQVSIRPARGETDARRTSSCDCTGAKRLWRVLNCSWCAVV
jgi:hypothetical protein